LFTVSVNVATTSFQVSNDEFAFLFADANNISRATNLADLSVLIGDELLNLNTASTKFIFNLPDGFEMLKGKLTVLLSHGDAFKDLAFKLCGV